MNLLRFGVVLPLVFAGCSPSLATSPSALAATGPLPSLAAKAAGFQRITLYVYSADDALGGNVNIVGVPITVSGDGFGPVTVASDKQSSATFSVPAAAEWLEVRTGATGVDNRVASCFLPLDVVLQLPLRRRDGWLLLQGTSCS